MLEGHWFWGVLLVGSDWSVTGAHDFCGSLKTSSTEEQS